MKEAAMDVIKVSGSSRTSAVAGAIAGVFRENLHAEVQAIGAGAVNQAVKALVLATGYLAEDGYEVIFIPEFVDVDIEGKTRTAVRLVVELRNPLDVAQESQPPVTAFSNHEPEEPFEEQEPTTPGGYFESGHTTSPAHVVPDPQEDQL
jgi:stage V sporulation protein S